MTVCDDAYVERLLSLSMAVEIDAREELLLAVWRGGLTTNANASPVPVVSQLTVTPLMWDGAADGPLDMGWARAHALNHAVRMVQTPFVVIVQCTDILTSFSISSLMHERRALMRTERQFTDPPPLNTPGANNEQRLPQVQLRRATAQAREIETNAFLAAGGFDERLFFTGVRGATVEMLLSRRLGLGQHGIAVLRDFESDTTMERRDAMRGYSPLDLVTEADLATWPQCCVGLDIADLAAKGRSMIRQGIETRLKNDFQLPTALVDNAIAADPTRFRAAHDLHATLVARRNAHAARANRKPTVADAPRVLVCVANQDDLFERMETVAAASVVARNNDLLLVVAWPLKWPTSLATFEDLFAPLPGVLHWSSWSESAEKEDASFPLVRDSLTAHESLVKAGRRAALFRGLVPRAERAKTPLNANEYRQVLDAMLGLPWSRVVQGSVARIMDTVGMRHVIAVVQPLSSSSAAKKEADVRAIAEVMANTWASQANVQFFVSPYPSRAMVDHITNAASERNIIAKANIRTDPDACDVAATQAPLTQEMRALFEPTLTSCAHMEIADILVASEAMRMWLPSDSPLKDLYCRKRRFRPEFEVMDLATGASACASDSLDDVFVEAFAAAS